MAECTLTREGLIAIGRALFGSQWQRELAHALCVGDRKVRYWAAGTRPMPETLPDDLRHLGETRSVEIRAAIGRYL